MYNVVTASQDNLFSVIALRIDTLYDKKQLVSTEVRDVPPRTRAIVNTGIHVTIKTLIQDI